MDSLLYQLFAGKKLNLDRFAVPKEFYPIVSRYLDWSVCLSKVAPEVLCLSGTCFGCFYEWIVPSFPDRPIGVTYCLPPSTPNRMGDVRVSLW